MRTSIMILMLLGCAIMAQAQEGSVLPVPAIDTLNDLSAAAEGGDLDVVDGLLYQDLNKNIKQCAAAMDEEKCAAMALNGIKIMARTALNLDVKKIAADDQQMILCSGIVEGERNGAPLLQKSCVFFAKDPAGTWQLIKIAQEVKSYSQFALQSFEEDKKTFGQDDDQDGLFDDKESDLNLLTHDPDTDGDSWYDGIEVAAGTDPGDLTSYPFHQ